MNILSVRNLKKYYRMGENTVKALDGVDLDIKEGEFLAIVGTSGSGKSTLLHMLGGLDHPTSGEVLIDGKDISRLTRDELTIYRRRKIGFVFQNYNLLPLMNVYENIVLPIKLDGIKPDDAYIQEILRLLKLENKKYSMPNQLSGGQQQRVALAMNCSPVEAVKYIGDSSLNRKSRIRNGGNLQSMVRINLFRDKKQFLVIMCSLSLALSLFLVINVVIRGNSATNILNHSYDYDLRILNQTLLSDNEEQVITSDLIKKINNTKGVKDVRVLEATTAVVPYQEDVYGEFYKDLYQSRNSPGNYEQDMELYKSQLDCGKFTCRIVGVDDLEFERLNQKLKKPLDKEAFKKGEVAFASSIFIEEGNHIIGKNVRFSVSTTLDPQKEESIVIGALTDYPAYYAAGYNPDLIVSKEYFEKLVKQPLIEMIKIDYEEPFSKSMEDSIVNLIKDNPFISADSKLNRYSEMKNSENLVTILGGSIGFIVMLLAISNYLNMMSASIQNRFKEFAVLESIGMTRKQIKKMIGLESLCYAILSILITIIIGLPTSYVVFENFNIYRIPFSFPIINNLVLFLIIIAICIASSLLLLQKTENESIIELLRQDVI